MFYPFYCNNTDSDFPSPGNILFRYNPVFSSKSDRRVGIKQDKKWLANFNDSKTKTALI